MQGYTVIPSLSWRGKESWSFAAAYVTKGSVVAISARNWQVWPQGFEVMMESLSPVKVLCFGKPLIPMPQIASYPVKFHLKLIKDKS